MNDKNSGILKNLDSTKFSIMPDLIRHPEKPDSLIHLDSAVLHFVPGSRIKSGTGFAGMTIQYNR